MRPPDTWCQGFPGQAHSNMDSLRPERSLLDPKFEGYKLSPDSLPCDLNKLMSGVNDVTLRDDLFSLQHIRAFGNYNHLIRDFWKSGHEESVYFVDANYEVQEATVKGQSVISLQSVYRIPEVDKTKEILHTSLAFPSDSLACLGDGNGKLYIIHTGCRSAGNNVEWKVVLVYQFERPFIILHSLQEENSRAISCLLLSTVDRRKVDVKESCTVLLDMAVFSQVSSLGSISCSCEMVQHFKGLTCPLYAALEPGNAAILVASEKSFHLVKESDKTAQDNEVIGGLEKKSTEVAYDWSQTAEDLMVRFELPVGSKKGDFSCEVKPDFLSVSLVGGHTLLRGQLFARIDSEASTWTLTDDKLELTLQKQINEHHWTSVVVGDDRGHYEVVGEEAKRVQEIHERLEHLTSDKLNPDPDPGRLAFDPQQLEECDAFPDDTEYVYRLDTRTGEVTSKVCLASHQWLFSTTVKPQLPPVFSVRHDVDALLWQPVVHADGKLTWTHVGTFNALGYVQASKENRKFSSCSPDMKYAVLCDCTRHVYVYRQPVQGSKVAYQHVVTLEGSDNSILGLQASNSGVYILTPQNLYFIKVSDR